MTFVDSGFLIALFQRTDGLHARATRWAAAVLGLLLTTESVLLEVCNHFSRGVDLPKVGVIQRVIMTSPQYEVIALSSDLFATGLATHQRRADKEWSLTDCVSFHVMADRGIRSALAYDHHFEQAGSDPLLRREP